MANADYNNNDNNNRESSRTKQVLSLDVHTENPT